MDKRNFLKNMLTIGVGAMAMPAAFAKDNLHWMDVDFNTDDVWEEIRKGYRLKKEYINLENGYYCFMPQALLERYIHRVREANLEGSYYLRTTVEDDRRKVAARLAQLADCTEEELVITRNTTESLDLVIGGLKWNAGDEAIMAEQDYGSMLDMFDQVAKRYGVVNKRISLPNNPQSDDEIVQLYESKITAKTRLIMVCHIVNITGQILPVRKICEMAHSHGVEVMVDGAHSFAHIPSSMRELDCDYYGSSLHKWLSAPLGCGLLYVKREKIAGLWPLFAESPKAEDDIYRLNHTGTTPVHVWLGINDAIDFYEQIGAEKKEQRLRFLQNYWTDQVRHLDNIIMNTPEDPLRSCAIANVGIEGIKPTDLAKTLMEKFKIWTVAIDRPGVAGVRITPNIYTNTAELDKFVMAMAELSR
jgi:selenocysteine lyase/cysteine desulfurase